MSQTETINPANIPKPTFEPTEGLSKIAGKEITVIGFSHNRGKPNASTDKSKIGADGLTDYFTIVTEQKFNLEHKDKGTIPINHFYGTQAIHKQLLSWFGGESANGAKVGPVKAVKRKKTENPRETFWALSTQADPDYNQ